MKVDVSTIVARTFGVIFLLAALSFASTGIYCFVRFLHVWDPAPLFGGIVFIALGVLSGVAAQGALE